MEIWGPARRAERISLEGQDQTEHPVSEKELSPTLSGPVLFSGLDASPLLVKASSIATHLRLLYFDRLIAFRLRQIVRHIQTFRDQRRHHTPENENAHCVFHRLTSLPCVDSICQQHHPYPNPETKNAGHPNSDKEAVFMTQQKPKRNTRNKTHERGKQKWIVYFVKHGPSC